MSNPDQRKIYRDWVLARDRVEEAMIDLQRARDKLHDASKALGDWFKPPDYKPGEVITTWIDGHCYSIREVAGTIYSEHGRYVIEERKAK